MRVVAIGLTPFVPPEYLFGGLLFGGNSHRLPIVFGDAMDQISLSYLGRLYLGIHALTIGNIPLRTTANIKTSKVTFDGH